MPRPSDLPLATWLVAATALASPESERPNIVLFLVDDMGWQDSSVSYQDEPTPWADRYSTPTMERLAAGGLRFSQAYAYSVCSPTRTSLMTGQNAARHHVTQWTLVPGRDPSPRGAGYRSPDWKTEGLQPGGLTLPSLLSEHGYRTIHAGKAHWGAEGTAGEDPCALGFDVNIAGHAAGGPASHLGLKNFARGESATIWDVPGLEAYHGQDVTLAQALTAEALEAVELAVSEERPFFLHMAHYAVHAPIEADARFVERYIEAGLSRTEANYASMIEGVDRSLRTILDRLSTLGVAQKTLIFFLSDNGGLALSPRTPPPWGDEVHSVNWPLKSGKVSGYEGGLRVPMILSWAEANEDHPLQRAIPIAAGGRCDEPVHCDDVFPTIARWAGALDAVPDGALDGFDLTPALAAGNSFHRPAALIFHYPHFYCWSEESAELGYGAFSAVRRGPWKAIWFYDRSRWELYDLDADVGERHNLAGEQPEVLAELAKTLVQELEAFEAQFPFHETTKRASRPVVP